jgi:hypothetical protein
VEYKACYNSTLCPIEKCSGDKDGQKVLALSSILERDPICQVAEFGEGKAMLESSDLSFEQQRSNLSDLCVERLELPRYSCSESEEVPFMQQSLPNFNEVYEVIQKKGQCRFSGFKKLEEVSHALQRYGSVNAYHGLNQDPAVLAGGKALQAIWNDSGEPGRDIHIAVIKATESGSWESDDFVLHPGQLVLWDPSEVRYLPLSPDSEGDRSSNWFCSFTVVVEPEKIDAAKQQLEEFSGPFGLRSLSQSRYGQR